jgi:hypothetical protein
VTSKLSSETSAMEKDIRLYNFRKVLNNSFHSQFPALFIAVTSHEAEVGGCWAVG